MLDKINNLENDFDQEEELEKFFATLQKYNKGR